MCLIIDLGAMVMLVATGGIAIGVVVGAAALFGLCGKGMFMRPVMIGVWCAVSFVLLFAGFDLLLRGVESCVLVFERFDAEYLIGRYSPPGCAD